MRACFAVPGARLVLGNPEVRLVRRASLEAPLTAGRPPRNPGVPPHPFEVDGAVRKQGVLFVIGVEDRNLEVHSDVFDLEMNPEACFANREAM